MRSTTNPVKPWKKLAKLGVTFDWKETSTGNTKVICEDKILNYRKTRYLIGKSPSRVAVKLNEALDSLAIEYCMDNNQLNYLSVGGGVKVNAYK